MIRHVSHQYHLNSFIYIRTNNIKFIHIRVYIVLIHVCMYKVEYILITLILRKSRDYLLLNCFLIKVSTNYIIHTHESNKWSLTIMKIFIYCERVDYTNEVYVIRLYYVLCKFIIFHVKFPRLNISKLKIPCTLE